jgi:hypothetical protein
MTVTVYVWLPASDSVGHAAADIKGPQGSATVIA